MKELFDRIESVDFPINQYIKKEYPKRQIVIHHSAGWDDARGMFAGWARDRTRVATCCGITDDGKIYQAFGSQYFGYHLGCGKPELDKQSIGVEICNWGWLKKDGDRYLSYVDTEVAASKVQHYLSGFRGHKYYEKYTDAEIESLRLLLLYWGEKYDIPLDYKEDMWDVSTRALSGVPGVWSHTSFRGPGEKWDAHPQPELIEMLKSLKQ